MEGPWRFVVGSRLHCWEAGGTGVEGPLMLCNDWSMAGTRVTRGDLALEVDLHCIRLANSLPVGKSKGSRLRSIYLLSK